ncbi:unnamed protein product [Gadus morhua 'NCC']
MPAEKRRIQERERQLKEAAKGSTSLQGWLRKSQQADEEQPPATRKLGTRRHIVQRLLCRPVEAELSLANLRISGGMDGC